MGEETVIRIKLRCRTLITFPSCPTSILLIMGCVASRPKVTIDEKRALLAEYASNVVHFECVDTTERLNSLREAMKACCLDAYIVGTEDAHASQSVSYTHLTLPTSDLV